VGRERRAPSSWRVRLSLLAASTVVSVGLAEGVARMAFPVRLAVVKQGAVRLSENPRLMYELTPSIQDHNRWGLRGADCALEKPPGVLRVAALGDSLTYGHGVGADETWARHLERLLDERGTGAAGHEVLNFGCTGYSIIQEAEVLRAKALEFEPDVVVLMVCLNDWRPDTVEFEALLATRDAEEMGFLSAFYDPANSWLRKAAYRSHLFRSLSYAVRKSELVEDPSTWSEVARDRTGRAIARDPSTVQYFAGREFYRENFERLQAAVAERGIPLVVIVVPYHVAGDEDEYRRRLAELRALCDGAPGRVVDFLAWARERAAAEGGDFFARDDLFLADRVHLTSEGLRWTAEALCDAVAPLLAPAGGGGR